MEFSSIFPHNCCETNGKNSSLCGVGPLFTVLVVYECVGGGGKILLAKLHEVHLALKYLKCSEKHI